MQVQRDMNGKPNPKIRRQGAASGLSRNTVAAGPARKNRTAAIQRLIVRQKPKQRATVERILSLRPAAMAAETILVTARLMPEVDSVTVSIKTEKIS